MTEVRRRTEFSLYGHSEAGSLGKNVTVFYDVCMKAGQFLFLMFDLSLEDCFRDFRVAIVGLFCPGFVVNCGPSAIEQTRE